MKKCIPVPANFLDLDDNPWSAGPQKQDMDLAQVIAHTVRFSPVARFDDAERGLAVIMAIKAHNGSIALAEDDYDWLITQMKGNAHKVWLAPDAAYLVQYIESHVREEATLGNE